MTLAKENPTELNLSEEVVSAAKDDGADQLNQLEPLLRLLMDLNGVEPSRENGKEKSQPQDSQENFQEMIDDRAPVALEWENNSSQPQESLLDGAIVPSSSPCVSPSEIPSSVPKPAPDASEEALEALLDLLLGSSGSKTTVTETPVSTAQETVAEVPEKEAPVLSFLSEIASISPEEETSQLPAPEKELFTEQPNLSPTSENLEKELVTETEKSSVSPSAPEKSTSPQRKYPVETETPSFDIKSDELVDPLSLLQNILMGTQISEVKEVNESLADKVEHLEHQLYDPDKLVNLLLPHVMELLNRKVAEASDEMAEALAPIVDEAIYKRSQTHKSSLSVTLAPLLPDAIREVIERYPTEIAKALSPEVALAIQEQIRLDRDAMAEALGSEMGRAIKNQIELERDAMVDALYPVIGNTISKYMTEAIRSINEKVEKAFSIEGISRKMRAQMQGVSEAELIFKESIPFTVQAVFLIHKASGLIISEVQNSTRAHLEADMIAGMLTAIRSFVKDCIVQDGELSELNEVEYGDSKLLTEVAGYCYLAVVIKGEPSKYFIAEFRETLATIIIKYAKPVENFEGDPSTIPDAIPTLLDRLMNLPELEKKKDAKAPFALVGIIAGVFSIMLLPWGYYQYRQGVEKEILTDISQALIATPELSVYHLNQEVKGDKIKLTGRLPNPELRKKAETITKITAPTWKIDNQIIAVDVPPDPVIVQAEVKRITKVLNLMEGVSISSSYLHRRVTVEGTVMQMTDTRTIVQAFKQIPGVQSVVSTIKLNPLKISTRVYFDAGSERLSPAYEDTINTIKEFLKQYPLKHLKITGHSDKLGSPTINQKLALNRAEAVRNALVEAGVDPKRLEIVGVNNPPQDVESSQPLLLSRCVTFEPITVSNRK
jgi:flagellar motor protein MotB